MSLIRSQTIWTGVAGSPFYTNIYCIGPLATNNGNDMANAWRVFLNSLSAILHAPMVATISAELLEFDETTGNVTGAGNTIQTPVTFTGSVDALPPMTQALLQWHTSGIVHNRRVKGRTNIPGVMENQNDPNGKPLPLVSTPLLSGAQAYLTSMSGRARIWAQPFEADPANPDNPTRPGSSHAIDSVTVAPYWAVLRSRRD